MAKRPAGTVTPPPPPSRPAAPPPPPPAKPADVAEPEAAPPAPTTPHTVKVPAAAPTPTPEPAVDDTVVEDEQEPAVEEEDIVEEEEDGEPDFEMATPVRKAKVVKVAFEDDSAYFVKEWTTKVLFGMIKRVQKIIDTLSDSGVFAPTETGDLPPADVAAARNVQFLKGVGAAIANGEDDLYAILKASIFRDAGCKEGVDEDWLGDLPIADTVRLVKAVWYVNWEAGSLGKVIAAPGTASKKVKPKKH